MIEDSATVSLELMSRPECVTLVRSALSGLGERLELDAELLDDLKTAISEACNNVVLHAYGHDPGPLSVTLTITMEGVDVLVRDHGSGIRRVSAAEDRMGVGLAVISALADRAQFDTGPDGGGTDVRMFFTHGGAGLKLAPGSLGARPRGEPLELGGDVVVSLAPVAILANVFGRVARAVAAGSHFSVDRFSDLYPITDAIAAHAERAGTGGAITCSINSSSRRLELAVAPFAAGSGAELEPRGAEPGSTPLSGLADQLTVESIDGSELLRVVVIDHRDED